MLQRKERQIVRTLIYARYSSVLQQARSNEDQIHVCQKLAAAEGWIVVGVFCDAAISGAAGTDEHQRPGLSALLERVEAGDIDQVLVDSTSRIARHQGDAHYIRDRLNFRGARLFSLADGEIDPMMGAIKSLLDEHYRRDLAHNVKRGQSSRVAEGRAPGGLTLGYKIANVINERGQLVRGLRSIDAEDAHIIRRIFREYASGRSPGVIAQQLSVEGVRNARGRRWTRGAIWGDKRRCFGILHNRIYIGLIVWNKTSNRTNPTTRKKGLVTNDESKWIVKSAPELRIVDQGLWDEVQKRVRDRSNGSRPEMRRPQRLLSKVGRCGVCGGNWNANKPNGWGCAHAFDEIGCSNKRSISNLMYEQQVFESVHDRLLSPEAVAIYIEEYRREAKLRNRLSASSAELLSRRISAETAKIVRLTDAIAEGGAAFADIEERLIEIRAVRDELERERWVASEKRKIPTALRLADRHRRDVQTLGVTLARPWSGYKHDAVLCLRALIGEVAIHPHRDKVGTYLVFSGS